MFAQGGKLVEVVGAFALVLGFRVSHCRSGPGVGVLPAAREQNVAALLALAALDWYHEEVWAVAFLVERLQQFPSGQR